MLLIGGLFTTPSARTSEVFHLRNDWLEGNAWLTKCRPTSEKVEQDDG